MRKVFRLVPTLLFYIICYTSVASCQEEDGMVIEPQEIAAQAGQSVEFACSYKSISVSWYIKNGTSINRLNNSRIQDKNGTLTFSKVMETDDGEYICKTIDNAMNRTAILKYYVMPTYFMEGMIVVSINLALVVIFLGCAVFHFIKNKRDQTKQKKQQIYQAEP